MIKDLPSKRIDFFQLIGINEYTFGAVQVFLQCVKQFKGRTAVKIPPQFKVQIINSLMHEDFKIVGHSIFL